MHTDSDIFLEHFGVKGMKWGVRRAQKRDAKADAKWQKNIYTTKSAIAIHNSVADKMNNGGLDKLNNNPKFKGKVDLFASKPSATTKAYLKEHDKMWEEFTREAIRDIHGTSPSGKYVAKLDTSNSQWAVTVTNSDIEHAEELPSKFVFEVEHDNKGYIIGSANIKTEEINHKNVDDFLAHFGVKGMKWGVRKAERLPGVSGKTDREAHKDATEYARAKMFYGEGAGNRRKLITASVDAKRAKDATYGQAFDYHLQKQDMANHAQKARSERKRTDKRIKRKQRAGYVARRFTGELGTQAAFTAAAFAGVAFIRSSRGQTLMKNAVSKVQNSQRQRQGAAYLSDYFARNR